MKMYFETTEESITSSVISDDYIAPIISFSGKDECHKYIEFHFGKTELAEFCFSANTRRLTNFQLIGCKNFTVLDEEMVVPKTEKAKVLVNTDEDGYEISDENVALFHTYIYKNGVLVNFSDKESITHFQYGHLLFSLDAEGTICNIAVIGLEKSEIEHITEVFQNG